MAPESSLVAPCGCGATRARTDRQLAERGDRQGSREEIGLVDDPGARAHERARVLAEDVGADVDGEAVDGQGVVVGESVQVDAGGRRDVLLELEEAEARRTRDGRRRADGDEDVVRPLGVAGDVGGDVDDGQEPSPREPVIADPRVGHRIPVPHGSPKDVVRHVERPEDAILVEDLDSPVGGHHDLGRPHASHAVGGHGARLRAEEPARDPEEVDGHGLGQPRTGQPACRQRKVDRPARHRGRVRVALRLLGKVEHGLVESEGRADLAVARRLPSHDRGDAFVDAAGAGPAHARGRRIDERRGQVLSGDEGARNDGQGQDHDERRRGTSANDAWSTNRRDEHTTPRNCGCRNAGGSRPPCQGSGVSPVTHPWTTKNVRARSPPRDPAEAGPLETRTIVTPFTHLGISFCVVALLLPTPTSTKTLESPFVLVNEAPSSGVRFLETSFATDMKYPFETLGGAVAALDYDNDGWVDLFFLNGAPSPEHLRSDPASFNRLFRNTGQGRLVDATFGPCRASARAPGSIARALVRPARRDRGARGADDCEGPRPRSGAGRA